MAFDLSSAKPVGGPAPAEGGFDIASAKPVGAKPTPRFATEWQTPKDDPSFSSRLETADEPKPTPPDTSEMTFKNKPATGTIGRKLPGEKPGGPEIKPEQVKSELQTSFFEPFKELSPKNNLLIKWEDMWKRLSDKLAASSTNWDTMGQKIRDGTATPVEMRVYGEMLKDLVDGVRRHEEEGDKTLGQHLTEIVDAAKANPKGLLGSLVAGAIQDPELLGLGGLGTGAKAASLVPKMKKTADLVGRATEAGVGMAASEAVGQMADTGEIDWQKAAAMGVTASVPLAVLHAIPGLKKGAAEPKLAEPPPERIEPAPLKPKTEADFADAWEFGGQLQEQTEARMKQAQRIEPGQLPPRREEGGPGAAALTVAGASAAALTMANPEVKDKAGTGAIVAAAFLGMPEGGRALGPMLKASQYGSRVLERLAERSPGKVEFKKEELRSEINRQDVPKSEREVLEKVINSFAGESVQAADLMNHFKLETQNFELMPKETASFASYGLDRLGRLAYSRDLKPAEMPVPRTDVWFLPDSWKIPPAGHFESMGPNQYGHTRSFMEGGTRHVVEMQSDLQQHLTPLSENELKWTQESIQRLEKTSRQFTDMAGTFNTDPEQGFSLWPSLLQNVAWEGKSNLSLHLAGELDSLRDLDLRKGNDYISGEEAINRAYEIDATQRRFDPEKDVWHKVLGFEVRPRRVTEKIGRETRVYEASDAWDVIHELQPEAYDGSVKGEVFTTRTPVNPYDVTGRLIDDGWLPSHSTENYLQQSANALDLQRAEQNARIGNEPIKLELREKIRPIGEKMWPRRLIQEEMARAGKEGMPSIRFGSADTVAKVEGWARRGDPVKIENLQEALRDPRRTDAELEQARKQLAEEDKIAALPEAQRPFVSKGHQSIYDRYKDEITKYLKQLGGKEHTDKYGHTWLEVPTRPGVPPRMFGAANPRYLARLAALGIGASAGAYFSPDDKLAGAIEGTLGAALAVAAGPKLADFVKDMRKPDTRIRINRIGDDREELIHRMAISTWREQQAVEKLVPKIADREHLTRWLQGDRSKPLSPAQQQALGRIRQFLTTPGLGGRTAKAAAARFAAMSQGMKDVSAIMGAYGNAVARSVADTRMLDALEMQKDPAGNGMIMDSRRAPAGYEHIDHPLLQGYAVHPDIKSSLTHLLDTAHPGAAKRVALALLMGTKRALVSFSLFHATALSFAAQAASSNPVKFVKLYAQAIAPRTLGKVVGENLFIKQLRDQGHAGWLIDKAVKGGLQWSLGREHAGVEDIGSFYGGMHDIARLADHVFPGLSMPVKKLISLNHKFDGFMWDRLHAGMKLDIFAEKFQQLTENNARAHAKDPQNVKLLSEREIANTAALFSNSIFGGLNWRRAAEAVRSRIGRDMALGAFAPSARRIAQVALFAPDWLVSTTLPWINAFGKGTGIKGVLNAQTLADLSRQYLIRSGLFYLVVGDAINYASSGHHLWDNKDPLVIEMDPKGERHMIFNKHFLELAHTMQHPAQSLIGKLSYPIKESLNQLFGTEYLAPHADKRTGQISAGPPMEGSRLGHALRGINPIAVQQGFSGGTGQGLAGFFGVPIYGKTHEQRRKEADERRRKRTKQRIDELLRR